MVGGSFSGEPSLFDRFGDQSLVVVRVLVGASGSGGCSWWIRQFTKGAIEAFRVVACTIGVGGGASGSRKWVEVMKVDVTLVNCDCVV